MCAAQRFQMNAAVREDSVSALFTQMVRCTAPLKTITEWTESERENGVSQFMRAYGYNSIPVV